MSTKTLNLMLLPMLAILAVPASAATLELVGETGNSYGSIPSAPYLITVNGGAALQMMCDDAQTEIYNGYSWTANAWSLNAADLSDFKFASMGLDDYEVAAYIESEVETGTINAGDGNAAVWSIFDPSFNTSLDHSNVEKILSNAQTAVNTGNLNFSGIKIYTPSPLKSSQEFITGIVTTNFTPQYSPAPEPATFAMLGGGLLGLGLLGRRRQARD